LADSFNQFPVRIFAVIVLYKMQPSESIALRTLLAAIPGLQSGEADVRILLYDNTPGGQTVGVLPPGVQYKANSQNGALSAAYNYALEIAQNESFDWLLTLDQDTTLPIDFLCKLCNAAAFVAPMDEVAAIAPRISSDGRIVSPFTLMKHWMLLSYFPDGFLGIPLDNVYAINSAFMIKVSALKAIGGYDPRFNLDFCDLVIGHRLQYNHLRVFVAGNIHVEHELSVIDLKNRVTPGRYEDIQSAEEAFYDEYLGRVEGIVLLMRLVFRLTYKLWRDGATSSYFPVGLRFLLKRLFYSRKHRMKSWEQSIKGHSAVKASL
jgi:GT2 family glycosyltransferase